MNSESFFKALDQVDPELLADAAPKLSVIDTRPAAIAAAACLALALGGAMLAGALSGANESGSKQAEVCSTTAPSLTAEALPTALPAISPIPDNTAGPDASPIACWVPFTVHNGCQYIGHENARYDADFIGQKIGDAVSCPAYDKGLSDYGELEGSISGPVFEVKGVDPSFMLCKREDDGSIMLLYNIAEKIYSNGHELFCELLHLDEEKLTIRWQGWDSWNYDRNEYFALSDGADALTESLMELLCESETEEAPEDSSAESSYNAVELYLCRDDGLPVHIRAFRNGRIMLFGTRLTAVRLITDGEKLNSLIDSIRGASVPCDPPMQIRTTIEDCMNDERFGRCVPTHIPESFSLVYASIHRAYDRETGELLGTDSIEIEIVEYVDKSSRNISISIREGDQGIDGLPTMEELEKAHSIHTGYKIRLHRSKASILVEADYRILPDTVLAILASIAG